MNNLGSRRLPGARHCQANSNARSDKLPMNHRDSHLDNKPCHARHAIRSISSLFFT